MARMRGTKHGSRHHVGGGLGTVGRRVKEQVQAQTRLQNIRTKILKSFRRWAQDQDRISPVFLNAAAALLEFYLGARKQEPQTDLRQEQIEAVRTYFVEACLARQEQFVFPGCSADWYAEMREHLISCAK